MLIEIKRDDKTEDRYHVTTEHRGQYGTARNDYAYRSNEEVLEIIRLAMTAYEYPETEYYDT